MFKVVAYSINIMVDLFVQFPLMQDILNEVVNKHKRSSGSEKYIKVESHNPTYFNLLNTNNKFQNIDH